MPITTEQIREIRQQFARLKPATVTLDGHRPMTIKEAIFSLAPTLERMKKRGFDTQEIVERLHEKGIAIKPPTLTKYLKEYRRQKDSRKSKKQDTPPPPQPQTSVSQKDTALNRQPITYNSFVRPDIPDDEL
ncbi:protein MobC [Desulfovibrio sp.]|uniref:protein MobC n=1 Tax=Desulfovibrio sp. TaxID=885 RepID=UPI0030782E68